MAEHKDYGLVGAGRNLQLGKQGPKLVGNSDNKTFSFTNEGGVNLTTVEAANAVNSSDLVTKAQLDAVSGGISSDGFGLALGNISSDGDSSWTDGAVQTITNTTTISESIDRLNEALENVRNNTFVKTVDFTVDNSVGGSPLVSTLTITSVGNPNRYTIDWGDGTSTTATTDSTPTHTYTNNSNSPFDVTVTAFHADGSGEGSSASTEKVDFITLYTADPVADYDFYSGASGGSQITFVNDGVPVYFENTTTNTSSADATYTIEWGDGSSNSSITQNDFPGGVAGSRLAHTFTTSTETDQQYTVKLTLETHSTADPSVVPNNTSAVFKVYDTHTPEVSLDTTNVINEEATSGGVVTFTNNTENTIGSNADFGIYYVYNWGDGTTSTVSTGGGGSGDTGGTITHTYALGSTDQNNGANADYTGNLQVYSEHTNAPFTSSNFTVHVEPDVRASITASSTTSNLKSSNDSIRTVYKGTDLSGTNRAIITVENNSINGTSYDYSWGDGTADTTNITAGSQGYPTYGNITHDYSSSSTGSKTLTITASGTPDITAQTDTDTETIVVEDVPAAPAGLSSKSITWASSGDSLPGTTYLCANATDFTSGGVSAGDNVNTTTVRRWESATSVYTSTASDAYNSSTGTLSALFDGSADGTKTFTSSTGETGTFTSLDVTSEGDAYNEISATTYPQNFYQVFSARMIKNLSGVDHGVHSLSLSHDVTGSTNNVYAVYDNLTSIPAMDSSGATFHEETNGTLRYVSGVPYYNTGNPTFYISGLTVTNLTGQTYRSGNPVSVGPGTASEGSGSVVNTTNQSFADIEGTVSIISGGDPVANVGVGGAYSLGNISVDVRNSGSDVVVGPVDFNLTNVNGGSVNSAETSQKVQLWRGSETIDESAIPVSDSLGAGFDDDGVRITGFGSAGDTPTYNSATNYYTGSAWSGAVTVAGTQEAINRLNVIKHFTTDLSSGYVPVGPDLNTGRSGAQYFTFAFRRTTMSNFNITLSGTVSGLFIAAPGTDIDDASTLNGWLDASTTYGGAGTPGADTGNGGNGSNGCAFTSGDRIVDGTSYSNDSFTMTLGDQNATNATGNQILVRIKLESGDSLTALSIS